MRKIFIFFLLISSPTVLAAECPSTATTTISTKLEILSLYPSPHTGEKEWVEIKNNDSIKIDLANYTLEDGTAKAWAMSGEISSGQSLKIDSFPFQLNNGGDLATLKTSSGILIDTLSYETSIEGEIIYKNAPVVLSSETPSIETTPTKLPVISELIPNPDGSDGTSEWIELYNPSSDEIGLTGLYLDDAEGGSDPYKLTGTIEAESYLLISIEDSKISLNNSGDNVRLLGANNEVLSQIDYADSTEGSSYTLINGSWIWTLSPTPGTENLVTEIINDSQTTETNYENGDLSESVNISEVFPNPEGNDLESEWIEITNTSSIDVNLGNWIINDGSKPYIIPDNTIILAGSTLILYRSETGIALNNNGETIELKDYTGEIVDSIQYESSIEGESYSKIEVTEMQSSQASLSSLAQKVSEIWTWTEPSPGEKNPIWMQFKGEVTDYDESDVTIFDGISKWTFKTQNQKLDSLVFGIGNQILIRAIQAGGIYEITYSELLESSAKSTKNYLPWLEISALILGAVYLIYRYKEKKLAF